MGWCVTAWWTSPPATAPSVERRKDKEKQREECESLKEQNTRRINGVQKASWQEKTVLVLLSPRPCPTARGLLRVSKRILYIRVCTFSSGWFGLASARSVSIFLWQSSAIKYSKRKKKELVQFESLYGVRASGPIWNNEGWLSRCVDLGYVQGWRSSAESKCGWMWPGCSSYVGLNCIKMCGVRVQGSKRGAESLTSFLSCQRLIYVLHRATPRLS